MPVGEELEGSGSVDQYLLDGSMHLGREPGWELLAVALTGTRERPAVDSGHVGQPLGLAFVLHEVQPILTQAPHFRDHACRLLAVALKGQGLVRREGTKSLEERAEGHA